MKNENAVVLLESLAQEARLGVFRLLVQASARGLAAGVIGERLAIPASTLSFHLKELHRSGLVNAQQEGRFIYYSANYQLMMQLIQYLTENCCAGEANCCEQDIGCKGGVGQ